ncbi:MAG: glycosyltransferase family 2 protein [Chloroflexi bacterium]|nr:glycosyltransferase family 2 protein [Chloroflexota bacterium]
MAGVPPLSVFIPVYNGARYLETTIRSILGQTFEDFELVIADDGSTDGSAAILAEWARRDSRIRILVNPTPSGSARASNRVVAATRAPIVARTDQDDVSQPDRLRRQYEALQADPEAVLVGTLWEGIDAQGRRVRPRDRGRLFRRSHFVPFIHSSIMFRREAFERIGGYRDAIVGWSDFDLYYRLAGQGRILVLPDALISYRFHLGSGSFKYQAGQALVYRCIAERRADRDYTPLLDPKIAASPASPADHVRSLVSLGAIRLWAGGSPRILQGLCELERLPLAAITLWALLYGAWGELSPATLRLALSLLVRLGDWRATRRLDSGRAVEWRFQY